MGEIWIVLDALDECHEREWKKTERKLSWMKQLLCFEKANIHLIMTSRPEQHIESEIMQWAHADETVPIHGNNVTEDIRAYVHTRIRQDQDLKR